MADEIKDGFDSAFRDYETANLPASGEHEVVKSEVRQLGVLIQTEIDDLKESQVGGVIGAKTWSQLSGYSTTGRMVGDYAKVLGPDAGTHTDPVVGGTVDNMGVYRWSASPAGFERIGDLDADDAADSAAAAAASADDANGAALDSVRASISETVNLYDPDQATFGAYIDVADGSEVANSSLSSTGHIRVAEGRAYITDNASLSDVIWYDQAGDFLSGAGWTAGTTKTAPAGAWTMRTWFANARRFDLGVFEAATVPGSFDAYSSAVARSAQIALIDQRIDDRPRPNLYDETRITADASLTPSTGAISAGVGAHVTNYMPVTPGATYYNAGAPLVDWCWYDSHKRFISGFGTGWAKGATKTAPDNAAYLLGDLLAGYRYAVRIVAGSTAPGDDLLRPLLGKSIVWRGDSQLNANTLQPLVNKILGTWTILNNTGDGTQVYQLQNGDLTTYAASADMIVLEHGVNDWQASFSGVNTTVLGTIADAAGAVVGTTFYGRLKGELDYILAANPVVRMLRLTPTKTFAGTGSIPDWDDTNGAGHDQQDYTDAIKAVSALYSVPVLDLFAASGVNDTNEGDLLSDGLHWHDGDLRFSVARQVARALIENY